MREDQWPEIVGPDEWLRINASHPCGRCRIAHNSGSFTPYALPKFLRKLAHALNS